MNSPVQALLWRELRRAKLPLLFQQVIVISIAGIILSFYLGIDGDVSERDGPAPVFLLNVMIFFSQIFMLAAIATMGRKANDYVSSIGFPYGYEFTLPISTLKLLAISLPFICLLFLTSYFVPLILLSLMFDLGAPQWGIAFLIFHTLLITMSLTWWTTNPTANGIGWGIALVLFYFGYLIPPIVMDESTGIVSFTGTFLQNLICVLVLGLFLVCAYLGIKRQRYGEGLFGTEDIPVPSFQMFSLRNLLPSSSSRCPTHSSIAAEVWRERQLHGFVNCIVSGVLCGLLAIAFLRFAFFKAFEVTPFLALSGVFYSILVAILLMNSFGVSMGNGVRKPNLFDRTRPMSSATQLSIRLGASVIGLVVAAISMVATLLLVGPLIINGFELLYETFAQWRSALAAIPLYLLFTRGALLLIGFGCFCALYGAFNAWAILHPRRTLWSFAFFPCYLALILIAGMITQEQSEVGEFVYGILGAHSWLLVFGIPVASYYLITKVLADEMLTQKQFRTCLAACGAIALVFIGDLLTNSSNFAADSQLGIQLLVAMASLVPALALGVSLWTMGKIRHG